MDILIFAQAVVRVFYFVSFRYLLGIPLTNNKSIAQKKYQNISLVDEQEKLS